MSLGKHQISITDVSNLHGQPEREFSLVLAILFSVILHVALLIIIPHMEHKPLQKPIRFEVQMNKMVNAQAASTSKVTQQVAATQAPVNEPNKTDKPSATQKVDKKPPPNKVMAERPITPEANESAAKQIQENEGAKNIEQAASSKPTDVPATQSSPSSPGTEIAKDASSREGSPSTPAEGLSSNHSEASMEEAWNGYGQQLYEMVGRNKTYPAIAIRKHWEGAVKIQAKFLAGKLVEVSIQDSSGRRVLDDEALNMVKKAISQLSVNGGLSKKNFTVIIPVDFSLDS